MDYKEKYKQALENLKRIKAANRDNKELIDFIEYQYPELKESEDEKIRKDIISFLRSKNGYMNPDEDWDFHNRWIAWLEKQGGETNPYSGVSIEYNGHTWGMCARDGGVDICLDKQLLTHLEKQGEQKPANYSVWVGGSEVNDNYLTKEEVEKLAGKYRKDGYEDVAIEKIEQKPAWSEEDEKILETLINDTEKTLFAIKQEERPDIMSGLSEIYIERLRWLKSLKQRMEGE